MNQIELTPQREEDAQKEPVVRLTQGTNINVNGVFMKILNVTPKTVTLRPNRIMVFNVAGVPCKLKKLTHQGDLVLGVIDDDKLKDAVPIGTEVDRD